MRRSCKHGLALLVLSLTLLAVHTPSANAEFQLWDPPSGVSLTDNTHPRLTRQAVAVDDVGNSLVVWSEMEGPLHLVRGQLYDAAGAAQWGEAGMVLAEGDASQFMPVAAHAGDRWYVAWHDMSVDDQLDGSSQLYVQTFSSSGNALWGDALLIGDAELTQTRVQLFGEPDGAAMLIWPTDNSTAQAQRIEADGTLAWADAGVALPLGVNNESVRPDGAGGLYFLERTYAPAELRAHRLDATGSSAWDAAGRLLHSGDINHRDLALGEDGSLRVAWTTSNQTVLLQGVSRDNVLLWNSPDSVVVTSEGVTGFLLAATEQDSELSLMLQLTSYHFRLFRLSIDATGLQHLWNSSGVLYDPPMESSREIGLHCQSGLTLVDYIAWGENSQAGRFLAAFDSSGSQLWGGAQRIGDRPVAPRVPMTLTDGRALLAARVSTHQPEDSLFVQAVNLTDGSTQWAGTGQPFAAGSVTFAQDRLLETSPSSMHVGWSAVRKSGSGESRRVPVVDRLAPATGERLWGVDPPALIDSTGFENTFRATLEALQAGSDGAVYGLYDHTDTLGEKMVYAQKLSSEGSRAWGALGAGVVADYPNSSLAGGYLALRGDGVLVVGFNELNMSTYLSSAKLQALDGEGNRLWGDEGIDINPHGVSDEREILALHPNGQDQVWVIWSENPEDWENPERIYAARFGSDGAMLGAAMRLDFDGSLFAYLRHVEQLENGNLVLMLRGHLSSDKRIFAFRPDGSAVTPAGGLTLPAQMGSAYKMAASGAGFWLTSMEENLPLRLQRYSWQGQPQLLPDEGIELAFPPNSAHEIVGDSEQGVLLIADLGFGFSMLHLDDLGEPANPLYGPMGVPILSSPWKNDLGEVVSDGEGGAALLFRAHYGVGKWLSMSDLRMMRVNDLLYDVEQGPGVGQPLAWQLEPAWPNPFNASTAVSFLAPERGEARVTVYDLLGRRVATLLDREVRPGRHTLRWNSGEATASGVYFVRLVGPGVQQTRRVVLLR